MYKVRGFTLIEILVSTAIIVLVGSITVSVFSSFNRERSLMKDVAEVAALIEEARALTLSSKDRSSFGVRFEADRAIRFQGTAYVEGAASNVTVLLGPSTTISSISLSGGGNDVVFEKLTGDATRTGSVTIALLKDPSRTKVIQIFGTGIVQW